MAIYELSALFLGYQQSGKEFKKIKVRNQLLPYDSFADFTTDTEGQTDIAIKVYQGVTEDNK
jgi:molecular chaperone DnaK (HSP70)